MKKTAIEFLIEEMSIKHSGAKIYFNTNEQLIQQAKEMEKQEKLECFIEGYKQRAEASNLIFDNASRMYATALFNETFKQQEQ